MKKTIVLILALGILGSSGFLLRSQEKQKPAEESLLKIVSDSPTYNPEGRRDPFKNLLQGAEVRDKTPGGIRQMSIDEIVLTGIVKSGQQLTAIVSGPQGFPYFIKTGEKFADGYVLSITDSQVVFRKTNERGVPLMRSKDIIKEINPEER
jgi:Tfp pilus assembly protein PilP